MDLFVKIAPHLANPIVLIGFVLMLFFGIHKILVTSGIIPKLKEEDAPAVVRLLLTYGFWIALVIIVAGFGYSFANNYVNAAYLTGNLKLVEANVIDNKEKSYPVLDVSFRNDGKAIASITRANINIKNVWVAKSPYSPAARLVSYEYKTVLPLSGAGCKIEVPINQDVPSNGSDRFTIIMGNDSGATYDNFLYHIDVEFIFNETEEKLSTGGLIFISRPAQEWLAANVNFERRVAASVHNQYVVKAIEAEKDVKIAPDAKEWIEEHATFVDFLAGAIGSKDRDREERLNALNYLKEMGYSAKPAIDKLNSHVNEGSEISEEIKAAVLAISNSTEKVPPITKTRLTDNHKGCSPAPESVTKRTSFPF